MLKFAKGLAIIATGAVYHVLKPGNSPVQGSRSQEPEIVKTAENWVRDQNAEIDGMTEREIETCLERANVLRQIEEGLPGIMNWSVQAMKDQPIPFTYEEAGPMTPLLIQYFLNNEVVPAVESAMGLTVGEIDSSDPRIMAGVVDVTEQVVNQWGARLRSEYYQSVEREIEMGEY